MSLPTCQRRILERIEGELAKSDPRLTALFLIFTGYKLLYADWRGYVVSFFSLVFVANIYIGIFGQVKLGVKKERAQIKSIEKDVQIKDKAA